MDILDELKMLADHIDDENNGKPDALSLQLISAIGEIRKLRADLAASQAECERLRIPIGWKPAPFEPTAEMLDVAVSHALTVQISGEYNWSAYMRDVWMRMWSQIGAQSIPRAALAGEVKP